VPVYSITMSPDSKYSPTSVIQNGLSAHETHPPPLVSLKSLPSAAGDLLVTGPPVQDFVQEGEDMAARGLVRADLASLSDLDRRALLKTGPPEGRFADASEEHENRVKEAGSEKP
jgi:hypothetical protein